MKIMKFLAIVSIAMLTFSCSQEEDFITEKDAFFDCINDDCGPILIDPPFGGGPGGGTTNDPIDHTGGHDWDTYFYTHRGETNHNIYYATSDTGTPGSWTEHQLGLGAKSSEGTASILYKGNRILFYKGSSSENIFLSYKESPTGSWQGNTWINYGSKTDRLISAAVFKDTAYVAYRGQSYKHALYLAYSTTGTDSYTQLAVPMPTAMENVKEYTIVPNGEKLYVFWTRTDDDAKKVEYATTTSPKDPNSWTYFGEIDGINGYNGLSATSHNGFVYLALGIRVSHPTSNSHKRHQVALFRLGTGNQNPSFTEIYWDYYTKRRPGIMVTPDSKLLISFAGQSTDRINTMKVNLDGSISAYPYESGGETKVGGVFSSSTF